MHDAGKTIYQPIDHTGDLGMLVFGADLHELFAHAAWGLFDLMTDAERIEPRIRRDLTVEAMDLEDLMVRWLGELLYAYDTDRFLTVNAVFHTLEPTRLQATLRGETVRRRAPSHRHRNQGRHLSPDRRRVLRQRLAGTGHFRHLICHAGGWLQPCGVDLRPHLIKNGSFPEQFRALKISVQTRISG